MTSHKEAMIAAARAAGVVIKKHFTSTLEIEKKPDATLVTQADKETERAIVRVLAEHFSYGIIAEESGVTHADSEYAWVIDPIDGTSNFIRGIPLFGTCVGLLHRNIPVAGVIYDPLNDELFFAEKGKGATMNGQPISCAEKSLERITFIGGWFNRGESIRRVEKIIDAHPVFRNLGSAVTGLSMTAKGTIDAYIGLGESIWDAAAGIAIATEAGCIVSTWDGENWTPEAKTLLVAPPDYHSELLELLK